MDGPEEANSTAIRRLEGLLDELRASASTARETEAIREIGYEIAIAIREVGVLLASTGRDAPGRVSAAHGEDSTP